MAVPDFQRLMLPLLKLATRVSRVGPGYVPGFSRLSFHGKVFSDFRASLTAANRARKIHWARVAHRFHLRLPLPDAWL